MTSQSLNMPLRKFCHITLTPQCFKKSAGLWKNQLDYVVEFDRVVSTKMLANNAHIWVVATRKKTVPILKLDF